MLPTNKLRWAQRGPNLSVIFGGSDGRVLQQWWEEDWANHVAPVGNEVSGEWRDVPVETE
jgi:hypothetical protein